jgi:predicted small lipoprotein YifL
VKRSRCLAVATIGALAAALALAGCGRKGALDPPPGGYVLPSSGMTPVTGRGLPQEQPQSRPRYGEDGRPIAPSGPERRIPADWLID